MSDNTMNLVITMSDDTLAHYIESDKHVEECKAEWLKRHGIEYPFKLDE